MGFVFIRHSAVELRRVNMGRVPKILCMLVRFVGKIGEVGERELVLVVSVKCGKDWDMTRRWQLFQDIKMSNPEPSSSWNTRVRVMKNGVQYVLWHTVRICTCCLSECSVHTLRRLSGSFSPVNWNWSQLQNFFFSQIVRPWRMLRVPTARLPMSSIPIWWRWRSCRQVSPRLFIELPACLRVNREVAFFDALECLSSSLSYLLTARNGSVVLLGPCQVLFVQSFAFSFRLSKSQVVDWVVAEVLLSNFEFSQLLLPRRNASPRKYWQTALCFFLSTQSVTTNSCAFRWRTIAQVLLGGVHAFFLTGLFQHLFAW